MDPVRGRVQTVEDEISGIDLDDRRLEHRSVKFCRRIAAEPALGFPQAMVTPAELEGCYRLLGNDKVNPEAILAPHFNQLARQAVAKLRNGREPYRQYDQSRRTRRARATRSTKLSNRTQSFGPGLDPARLTCSVSVLRRPHQ